MKNKQSEVWRRPPESLCLYHVPRPQAQSLNKNPLGGSDKALDRSPKQTNKNPASWGYGEASWGPQDITETFPVAPSCPGTYAWLLAHLQYSMDVAPVLQTLSTRPIDTLRRKPQRKTHPTASAEIWGASSTASFRLSLALSLIACAQSGASFPSSVPLAHSPILA